MEREGVNGRRLLEMVKTQTGISISDTMLSFILRGSRRCSWVNAQALSQVTGVPFKVIAEWPKVSESATLSGRRQNRVA